MRRREFIFWAALPPVVEDLRLFDEAAGLAEPLVDLRYGSASFQKRIAEKAVQLGRAGLTVIVDCRNEKLIDFSLGSLPAGSRVILSSTGMYDAGLESLIGEFNKRDIVVGVEVDSRNSAGKATGAGADFLVSSGNEAYGPVSEKTSLVLIQELLEELDIPLVIRGSLGPQGAAGAMAAGCAGCILDSQLLLVDGSGLSEELKKTLVGFSPSDTTVVGATVNHPCRLLCIGARDEYQLLLDEEKRIFRQGGSPEEMTHAFEEVLERIFLDGFSKETSLLPVGQGIAFAQQFAEKDLGAGDVLRIYRKALSDSIASVKANFPLSADSALARLHKVKYPIVQGPMARITDGPRLAVEVAKCGGLPFVAAGGLSPEDTRRMLAETRSALGEHPFGVGVIGFSSIDKISKQMEAVLAEPPDFVTIAGGDPDLARKFEDAGIGTYLHAPSRAHVKDCIDKQVKGIILEGHEAGGHVGELGSLILWELGLREIASRCLDAGPAIRVLLAGGIANTRGALVAAVLASPLLDQRLALGLQIGTAYLMTDEAVESGAIPLRYSRMLQGGDDTILVGRSVNLPSQWLATRSARKMLETEIELEKEGLPLAERKKKIQRLDRDHLIASVSEDSSLSPAYLCGQMISVQRGSRRIADLHRDLTTRAQQLGESCPMPVEADELPMDTIAIVGMGCIFPGANTPSKYWENILNCVDTVREVPKKKWDPEIYFDPDRNTPDKSYSKIGAFIEGFEKDPTKFRIPPVSAPYISNTQFLALEVVHQALEDAGYLEKGFPRKRTAVFLGHAGGGKLWSDYNLRAHWGRFAQSLKSTGVFNELEDKQKGSILDQAECAFKQELPEFSEDTCGGIFSSIVAGRVSNCFNLGGVNAVINSACASSLAAIDAGVTSLRDRHADLVVAGGVDTRVDAETYVFFSSLGSISAKGSFPFDERADGFVLGEGAGAVLLKRLDDALGDGDKIYAVIRSLGGSSDGRVKGITAPDRKGQVLAIQRAYEKVPFTPDTISLVEAHGTGTWVGDITEISSLTEFFRQSSDKKKSVGLGSVKSMIGHLKSASGIAGLIKVVLALHNRILPPTINCDRPRKDIDWENSPFYLLTEPRPWNQGPFPRRAAVDSFGFGGINFHAILEEAPDRDIRLSETDGAGEGLDGLPAELMIFRAPTRADIRELVTNTKDRLTREKPSDLRELAIDLQKRASSTGPTLAVVAADVDTLISHLDQADKVLKDESRSEFTSAQGIYFGETPLEPEGKVAFLFPGQGSQYINMGGDLPACFPFVGNIFSEVDSISRQHADTSVLPMLVSSQDTPECRTTRLKQLLVNPDYNHRAMLAMGIGIFDILGRAGIRPDMVAGHSLGEYLALYAADVFDSSTAIRVTTCRGDEIARRCLQNGAMASIGTSAEMLDPFLKEAPGFVAVANKNCPAQTVVSGDVAAVENVMTRMEKEGIPCKLLPVSCAYHTHLLTPCVEPFGDFLGKYTINRPRVPVQSNLTGRAYETDGDFTARLRSTLVRHLIHPVDFIGNVLSMYKDGARLFIEVGPGSTLCSFVDNILTDKPHWTIPTNLERRSATLQLLHALAFCAARGLPVNVGGIVPPRRLPLRRTAQPPAAIPRQISPASKPEHGGIRNLVGRALADQEANHVERYLEQRGDFLKDMLRQDFKHFARRMEEKKPLDDSLERYVVELISRKTGYPTDVINIDLDVEAELGLDSIKQVEIIRELASKLNIDFGEDPRSQRYKITTPRKLIETASSLISAIPSPEHSDLSKQEHETDKKVPGWKTQCFRWVFDKVPAPLSEKKNPRALENQRVLLLSGECEAGILLKERLTEAGAIVTVVSPSNSPDDLLEDYDLVLDLWAYAEDEIPALDECEEWWEQTAQRASAVLKVAQNMAQSIRRNKNKKALWVEVTSLGGELGAHAIERVPAKAGIGLGMSRCLLCEFPDSLEGFYLDFGPGEPDQKVAEHILDELTHERSNLEIGYMDGERFELRWKIEDPEKRQRQFQLGPKSVVLAIGGARGVTASICHGLAEQSGAQFVVVGRSTVSMNANDTPAEPVSFSSARDDLIEEYRSRQKPILPAELDQVAWRRVWESERSWNMSRLSAWAPRTSYRQCDITNAESVRQLIDEVWNEHGRLDLVIQGGGDLFETSIEDFNADEYIRWMKSKALGTACLLAALSNVKVGTFINMSSIAGRWGNQGQGSYAAGHEVASILVAGARAKRPGRWINHFYGPWLNVGMIRIGAVVERLKTSGVSFITQEKGCEFFIRELEDGSCTSVALRGRQPHGLFNGYAEKPVDRVPALPLLDHIEKISPEAAQGRRVFDLKRDRIISDHYVYYEHPIMPAVVNLEMIAQTASVLVEPGWSVTDIEDVELLRAGTFPRGEPREFSTRVRLISKDQNGVWLKGEVFSFSMLSEGVQPKEILHTSCRIRFGRRAPPPRPSLLLVSTGIGDCRVDAKPLWETKSRRRRLGLFRNIHSFSSVTRDGVVGEILAAQTPEFGSSPFLNNPIRLDGILDIINFTSDIFHNISASFIGSIKSIKFFSSNDPGGVRCCRARVRDVNISDLNFDLEYDVETMNSLGAVTERVSGVHKVATGLIYGGGLSEPIWDSMRENPRQAEIKRLLGCKHGLALAQAGISLVEGSLEADEDELLRQQLSEVETDRYRGYTHPKRRLEWLAGRIAAKGSVRMLLGSDAPLPMEIEIESSPNNSPMVMLHEKMTQVSSVHISISHSGDQAVAVAMQPPGIGIDVEEITGSIIEIAGEFSTDEDAERFMKNSGFSRIASLTGIWVVKEAAIKAFDTRACTMRELVLGKVETQGDYIVCELSHPELGRVKSVAFQSDKCVYAVGRLVQPE